MVQVGSTSRVFLTLMLIAMTKSGYGQRQCLVEEGKRASGSLIKAFAGLNGTECQNQCETTNECNCFAYSAHHGVDSCSVYESCGQLENDARFVSGLCVGVQTAQNSPVVSASCNGCSVSAVGNPIMYVSDSICGCSGTISSGGVQGAAASALCKTGWHVCRDEVEVEYRGLTHDVCKNIPTQGKFFATRARGAGNQCSDTCASTNIFGCGDSSLDFLVPLSTQCGVLAVSTSNPFTSITSSWRCDSVCQNYLDNQGAYVSNTDGSSGGVLCCKDGPVRGMAEARSENSTSNEGKGNTMFVAVIVLTGLCIGLIVAFVLIVREMRSFKTCRALCNTDEQEANAMSLPIEDESVETGSDKIDMKIAS